MPANKLLTGFLFALSLLASACQAKDNADSTTAELPATILGSWQVVDVLIDNGDSHWNLTRNDPYNVHEYLGRVYTITPLRISYNGINHNYNGISNKLCEEPKVIEHHTTLASVVATSMSSRLFDKPPTPKDFRLPLADDAPIDLLSLWCSKEAHLYIAGLGNVKEGVGISGAWLTVLGQEQLMLRWADETFLILKRLTGKETPVASFDCSKATTDVEKTICGSVALASYDQSVTQTYKLAITYYQSKDDTKEIIADLKKSQKLWLKERNTCGSDTNCLETSMGTRLGSISYDMGNYAYEHRN